MPIAPRSASAMLCGADRDSRACKKKAPPARQPWGPFFRVNSSEVEPAGSQRYLRHSLVVGGWLTSAHRRLPSRRSLGASSLPRGGRAHSGRLDSPRRAALFTCRLAAEARSFRQVLGELKASGIRSFRVGGSGFASISTTLCNCHDVPCVGSLDGVFPAVEEGQAKASAADAVAASEPRAVIVAPLPAQPIPKSLAAPGLCAWIAMAKYGDGLPLYRQETILARYGLTISRATLASWMIRLGELIVPLITCARQPSGAGSCSTQRSAHWPTRRS